MFSYFSKEPTAMKEDRQPLIERGNAGSCNVLHYKLLN